MFGEFIRFSENLKNVICRSNLKTRDIVCRHSTLKKKGIKDRLSQYNISLGSSVYIILFVKFRAMEYSEPLYEDRDTTGSCGDKEPVMQPDQVEGTNGVSSRYCPDEVHQEIIPGSHDTTSGSALGPVGQPNLREDDSVLYSKVRR